MEQEKEDTQQRKGGAVIGVVSNKGVRNSVGGGSPKKFSKD